MRRMRHLKPREIQGCQLALDASIPTSLYDATSGGSLVAADGAVARWEDQSGNGNHVTQAFTASRPLRRVANRAGMDALQFDNTNDYMENSGLNVARPVTSFVVVQTAADGTHCFHDSVSASTQQFLGMEPNFVAASTATISTGTSTNAWGTLAARFTSANGVSIQRNLLYYSTASNASGGFTGVRLCASRGTPATIYFLNGHMAEMAVFAADIGRSIVNRLSGSRMRKWRISG